MRGQLDAFRVINQRLRRLEPPPAEQALLALFDRAGFGPHVVFDPARLAAPELAGLRDAGAQFRNDIIEGPGGKQILLQDPSGNVVELFQPAR